MNKLYATGGNTPNPPPKKPPQRMPAQPPKK